GIVPAPMLLIGHAAGAMVFATAVAAAGEATRRWSGILASVTFPAIMAAFYFAAGNFSPFGRWGDPAYLLAGFTPLVQSVSVVGTCGINFAAALVPACIAVAWYRRNWHMEWLSSAIVCGATFGIVLLGGTLHMFTATNTSTVRVGMVAVAPPAKAAAPDDLAAAADLVTNYAKLVQQAAAKGAKVVVLPEKVFAVSPKYEFDIEEGFRNIASMSQVWLAVGFDQVARTPMHNIAMLFTPDGKIDFYVEHHLKPALELGYRPGRMFVTFDPPWGKTAVVVASDLDFPDTGRELSNVGVKLVLAPGWGWPGNTAELHRAISRISGIEGGFAVARSGHHGAVFGADSRGREIAAGTLGEDNSPTVVVADLPVGGGRTLYSRGAGDWFARFMILISIFVLARFGIGVRRQILTRMQYGLKVAAPAVAAAAAAQTAAAAKPEAPPPPPKKEAAEPEIYHAMKRPPSDY
ncbi:MAG TPA: carbon-nitrogen hydrolase family protein, partial [Candidatus Binataceae bacterium]|nr:carbon-nitrogen hydrolase family protein [Candidatus Binataceae bacterium]